MNTFLFKINFFNTFIVRGDISTRNLIILRKSVPLKYLHLTSCCFEYKISLKNQSILLDMLNFATAVL